ncbi:hypothetical protein BH686_07060 [Rhodococcus erythropolis]|nr:hypothetical protein BH686_07060 [Rhodococcus erythropolis]
MGYSKCDAALLGAENASGACVLVTAEGAEGGKGRAFPVRFENEDTRRAASVAYGRLVDVHSSEITRAVEAGMFESSTTAATRFLSGLAFNRWLDSIGMGALAPLTGDDHDG